MGMIYVFTGDGKGKTTAALGTAVRSCGHGRRVVIVQFMKKRKTGEIKFSEKTKSFEIHQFGGRKFVDPSKVTRGDVEKAKAGLVFCLKLLDKKPPDLLVLDEINVAIRYGLMTKGDALELIVQAPEKTDLVLTGRHAPPEIMEVADLVTDMKDIKHPYTKGSGARKGLDF